MDDSTSNDEAQNSDVEMKSSNAPVVAAPTQAGKKAQTPGRSRPQQRSTRRGMAGAGGGSKDFGAGSWQNAAANSVGMGSNAWGADRIVDRQVSALQSR